MDVCPKSRPLASLPFDNPYALLAFFLSPCNNDAAAVPLLQAAEQKKIDWGNQLYRANLNFCTPLWYVRLRQKGFLPSLPGELQEYLRLLHQANIERNHAFRLALEELLRTFQVLGIRTLLLKGAATFCDDLYEDPGARMMGDLDILIEPQFSEKARAALLQLGYEQQGRREQGEIDIFSGNRYHHLPRFNKPGTSVAVEIHTRTARRQDGRTLPDDLAWKGSEEAILEGFETAVLSPTHRLLHNTVHALVPQRNFIRSSIALAHLAEFASLSRRYESRLDWEEWFRRGAGQKLGMEFIVYLSLAHRLMALPWPDCVPRRFTAGIHLFRILAAGKQGVADGESPSIVRAKIIALATRFLLKIYYRAKEPAWMWSNLYYAPEGANFPLRVAFTFRKWARGGIGVSGRGKKTGEGKKRLK
jgi:hypothetical protein